MSSSVMLITGTTMFYSFMFYYQISVSVDIQVSKGHSIN